MEPSRNMIPYDCWVTCLCLISKSWRFEKPWFFVAAIQCRSWLFVLCFFFFYSSHSETWMYMNESVLKFNSSCLLRRISLIFINILTEFTLMTTWKICRSWSKCWKREKKLSSSRRNRLLLLGQLAKPHLSALIDAHFDTTWTNCVQHLLAACDDLSPCRLHVVQTDN